MRAAESGSDDWAIGQAFAEYEAYLAGERLAITVDESTAAAGMNHPDEQVQCFRFAWPAGGQVHFCGAPGDEAHWHAAYVGDGGQAVTPLAVGELADVKATWARVRDVVDPHQLSRPVVRFGDVRRHFKPTYGRFLVGVAQEGSSTILLAALGQQLAVVLVEGKRRVVLDIKAPLDLREVFVDRICGLQTGAAPRGARPPRELDQARVSSTTRARYIRIVHGLPIDVADGPSIPDVVWRCLKGIEHRAKALRSEPVRRRLEQDGRAAQEPCRPRRLKGKKHLRQLLRALFRCSLKGSEDLVGLTGVLRDEIQRHDPSFVITLEALADALNLLRATGTCLVTRADGERLWHVHLVGLNDPSSALHRRLLEETPIPFRFPAAATGEVLAEDDEATPTADLTVPSSSSAGGTSGGSPHEGPKTGVDDAGRALEQATRASEPAARDTDELAQEVVGAAAATSATPSAAEAGGITDAAGCSMESADAARGESTADPIEASGAVAAGDAASPSEAEGDAASAARLASSPLAPLLLLAVLLAAWETGLACEHAEVIAVRERLVTVLRDLVHLHAQEVPRLLDHVVEGPVERPAEPARVDIAEEAACAPVVRDEGDRLPADAPGDADAGVGPAPVSGLTEALDLHEPVVVPLVELRASTDSAEAEADSLAAPELHPESPPVLRAYLEVVGFLAWPRWFWATCPSLGGLPIPTCAKRDGDERGGHGWSGDDVNFCAASATPRGPLALGSLGARGPPGS